MITTRKLHVLLLIVLIINLLLPACSLHRTARRASSAQLMEYSRLVRRDSLAADLARRWTEARTLDLTEFTLSPPDSLGRQHLIHVRLAHAEATASDSLALRQRQTTATDAAQSALASTASDSQSDTRADGLRMPGWEWLAATILAAFVAIRINRKK